MTLTAGGAWRPVRLEIYRTFAETGRPPSVAELAAAVRLPESDVRRELATLAAAHAIVLTPAGDAIRMAHPFSAAPMGFVVTRRASAAESYDDMMWWGGCAWDSFGIVAALGSPLLIRTRCPGCGDRLEFTAGPADAPDFDGLVRIPRPAAHWWDDVVGTCSNIRLFCTAEHANTWAERTGETAGRLVPAETMWRLAQPWYGDRLRADWTPWPRAEAVRLLTDVGLTGEFWKLPAT